MSLSATIAGAYPKIGDSHEEQKLRQALHQYDQGAMSEEELENVAAEVTRQAITEQADAGMDLVTDGLIRWQDPLHYAADKISGFKLTGLLRWFDTNTFYRQPVVETRLEAPRPFLIADYEFAVQNSPKPVRAVITGPYTLAKLSRNEFYREFKQFLFDLAFIYQKEVKGLEEAGCQWIQFDEPALLSNKQDLRLFTQVYEIVLAGLSKAEKTLFLNFGSLEGLYPKILNLPFERFGFELTPGHENWNVLKTAPFVKKLMAGIVDARNTRMETENELAALLRGLEPQVAFDNLWVSTSHGLEFLPRENARNKMKLLAGIVEELKGSQTPAAEDNSSVEHEPTQSSS